VGGTEAWLWAKGELGIAPGIADIWPDADITVHPEPVPEAN
jgi:hypothetical protein